MRRLGLWGVGAVLLVGLGGVGLAGEAPSGGGAKPAARPWGGKAARKPADPPGPSAEDAAAAVRKREEAAYWRRVAVCDKLAEIAYQTGDTQLQEFAEQLSQRAFDVYMARSANQPTHGEDADLDEQLLKKAQAKTAAGSRLEKDDRTAPGQQDARAGGRRMWGR